MAYKEEEYTEGGKSLPDYQNVRNVIFHNWEELNNAVILFRMCNNEEYIPHLREVARCYLRFFAQVNDKTKLGTLETKERHILQYFNIYPEKITRKYAKEIQDITRKLMTQYGIFNLEGGSDYDYI